MLKYLLLENGPCPRFLSVMNEELQTINSTFLYECEFPEKLFIDQTKNHTENVPFVTWLEEQNL